MNFKQRLTRYLLGFAIGVIITGVFFKDRLSALTAWLPENAVKKEIADYELLLAGKAACQTAHYEISDQEFSNILKEGEILFSESSVKIKPRKYVFLSDDKVYKFKVQVDRKEELATVLHFYKKNDEELCSE